MNILLINPYALDFTAYDLWLRPLGLYYLSAVIKKNTSLEVFFLDLLDRYAEDAPVKENRFGCGKFYAEKTEKLAEFKTIPRNYYRFGWKLDFFHHQLSRLPEINFIFMTSLMTYWVEGLNLTIETCRRFFPRAKVVVGGIIPTLYARPERFVQADYFISGYGENKILDFLQCQKVEVKAHPDYDQLENLPRYDFLHSRKKYAPLLTSRGCPLKCTYCISRRINPVFERRSIEAIVTELHDRFEKHGTTDFVLFDDAFLIDKRNFAIPLLQRIKKEFAGRIAFHTPNALHLAEIDSQISSLLKECNFRTIRFGLESVDPQISGNKIEPEKTVRNISALRETGFSGQEMAAYILFGHPEHSFSAINATIDFAAENGVVPLLATYSPIPGSDDFLKLGRRGINLNHPLFTNKTYFLYRHSGLSDEEITFLKTKALRVSRQLKGIG